MLFERGEINLVDDAGNTVTAAGTKNGLYVWVIDHRLEIGASFLIGSAESKVAFAHRAALQYLETPGTDLPDRGRYFVREYEP